MTKRKVTTSQFLEAILGNATLSGAFLEIRALAGKGQRPVQIFEHEVQRAISRCRDLIPTHDVWFGPALRGRQRGADADIIGTKALWTDIDAKLFPGTTVDEVLSFVGTIPVPPSVLVNSGHGIHCYWLLQQSASGDQLQQARNIMLGIEHFVSNSTLHRIDSVHNLSRVLRLPNTLNHKSTPALGTSVVLFDTTRSYTLHQLQDAFPYDDTAYTQQGHPEYTAADFDGSAVDIREALVRVRAVCPAWVLDAVHRPDLHARSGDESALDWSIVRELVRHFTPHEVEAIWLGTAWGARDKVQSRADYRRKTIWKARAGTPVAEVGHLNFAPENGPVDDDYDEIQVGPDEDNDSLPNDTTEDGPIRANGGGGTGPGGGGGSGSSSGVPTNGNSGPAGWPLAYAYTLGRLERLGRNRNTLVANFNPVLDKEYIVVEDDNESRHEYEVSFRRDNGDVVHVRMTGEDLSSDTATRKKLSRALPADFIVYASDWKEVSNAMFDLALGGSYPKDRSYASMGWAAGTTEPVFILPGAAGGITAHGLDPNYRMADSALDEMQPRMKLYGIGVRPVVDADERRLAQVALTSLLQCHKPEVMIPLITQVLAGPLSSYGARRVPPVLHLFGRTGSYKTTISMLVLSMFGSAFDGEHVLETWLSTLNSLAKQLHVVKDMTLIIDDYKVNRTDPTPLVQAYGDGTTRTRMGPDQSHRTMLAPRGFLLSTGEDAWEKYESARARTLIVTIGSPEAGRVENFRLLLTEAQRAAKNGELALVGGTYLQWIARQSRDDLQRDFTDTWERIRQELANQHDAAEQAIHPRTLANLASLFTVGAIIERFLAEEFPRVAQEYSEGLQVTREGLTRSAREDAVEAAMRSPFAYVCETLRHAINAGSSSPALFLNRFNSGTRGFESDGQDEYLGSFAGTLAGYFDHDNIYLLERVMTHWFRRWEAQARDEMHFTWHALVQDAREVRGDRETTRVVRVKGRAERCLVIPRTFVDLVQGPDGPPHSANEGFKAD